VALLIVQYPLGKFMPHIHRGMTPGDAMTLHISFGITILALMVLRLFWRITHPVAPARSLPAWQQLISEAVHWLLYVLVFATTMTGWIFASEHGWSISLFSAVPLPMLPTEGSLLASAIGKWHGTTEWALLLVIGAHVAAAMAHTFIFRDQIMQRMLPEKSIVVRTRNLKPEVVAMKTAQQSSAGFSRKSYFAIFDRSARSDRLSRQPACDIGANDATMTRR
jgi:cytochrome b561